MRGVWVVFSSNFFLKVVPVDKTLSKCPPNVLQYHRNLGALLAGGHCPPGKGPGIDSFGQHGLPREVLQPLPGGGAGQHRQQLGPHGRHHQLGAVGHLLTE